MKFIAIFLTIMLKSHFAYAYDNFLNNKEFYNLNNTNKYTINGTYLKAWNSAFREFLQDNHIPKNKKDLRYYSVNIEKKGNNFVIYLSANKNELIGDRKHIFKGGSTLNTKSVKYWVNKNSFIIVKRLFFK